MAVDAATGRVAVVGRVAVAFVEFGNAVAEAAAAVAGVIEIGVELALELQSFAG